MWNLLVLFDKSKDIKSLCFKEQRYKTTDPPVHVENAGKVVWVSEKFCQRKGHVGSDDDSDQKSPVEEVLRRVARNEFVAKLKNL